MADFSVIAQTPEIRQIVQERHLERAFHESLYPRLLFRGEAAAQKWGANLGDSTFFTAPGLIPEDLSPIVPGQDATVGTYGFEQWLATMQQWGKSIDTNMPSSVVAIASLFMRNTHQLGLNAGRVLNKLVRDRLYNAALAGNTVCTAVAAAGATTFRVARLDGFTTARRPDLAAGSPVRYDTVSASNPLPILISVAGVLTAKNVTGFTPDFAGDQVGPGVLTIDATIGGAGLANRDAILAVDRSVVVRPGGGARVDDVTSAALLRLTDIRAAVARMRLQNVPVHAEGRFHSHIDPTSENQVFGDIEWQRLNTSLPDYYPYKDFALGEHLGCLFYRNTENPFKDNVLGGATATYDPKEPFGGEIFGGASAGTTAGVPIHRPIFTGQGVINEYYQDLGALITEAGITGKVGEFMLTNNGIDVYTDRIMLMIRSAQNRLGDTVAATWKFLGDWPVRTDGATGDAARYKRMVCIEHGE